MVQLTVIAKEPRPGLVKTRLCPPCTPEQAALIAEAALLDTLDAVTGASVQRRVLLLDGRVGPWIPSGFDVIHQRGASLGDRLAAAFDDCFRSHPGPVVVIAMDTPRLGSADLDRAVEHLGDGRAAPRSVLGPAEDGGYWLIGLTHADRQVFANVSMSTADTLVEQRRQLQRRGFELREVETLVDIDDFADALHVRGLAPGGRFARAIDHVVATIGGA